MKKTLLLSLLVLFSCSKDSPSDEIIEPVIQKYTLSVSGTNGGSVNTSGGEYTQGTSVTITATPNNGYSFTGWSGNATGTSTSLTIIINGNTSITANFEENIPEYSLTVSSSDGGTVNISGGEYIQGEEIIIIATPNDGYDFVRWEVSAYTDGTSTNTQDSITINMNQNYEIQAIFHLLNYQEVNFDYQLAYCLEGEISSTAWIGENLVIMIEGENPDDRDSEIMGNILSSLERVVEHFYSITQLPELAKLSSFDDKMVIEVVQDNCGAGGLAHHGVLGISVGIYFLEEIYNSFLVGEEKIHQIYFYEINRNFWKPSWSNKFDWAMDRGDWDWGFWTTGMNVAQAIIMPQQLDVGFIYYGWTLQQFRDKMVNNLITYMNNDEYNFENGWKQYLMPWDNDNSINDLMTGLIVYSYENFGQDDWLRNFYQYIDSDEIVDRESIYSYQQSRDNVYKIWSLSAESNLIDFFENNLKWDISDDAKNFVSDRL